MCLSRDRGRGERGTRKKRESIRDRIGSHRKTMTKERARVTGSREEEEDRERKQKGDLERR